MATTGSKKGKKKGKTVNLSDFLANGPSNSSSSDGKAVVTVPTYNWADTMDEEDEFSSRAPAQQITLPTAPRSAREEIDLSRLPDRPPFTAHVGNLSYDVDEGVLNDIFSKMNVSQVRLQMEMGRSKGYGYVEFADKQSLIDALELNGETFFNRKIRVDIATQSNNDRGSRYGDRDGGRGGNQISGEGDADDDWRGSASTPNRNTPSSYDQQDGRFGGRRGYDDRDSGFGGRRGYDDRDGGRKGYDDRDSGFGGRRGYGDREGGFGGRRGDDVYRGSSELEGNWDRAPARSTYDDRSGDRSRGGYESSDFGSRRGYDDRPRRSYDDGPRRDDRDLDYGRRSGPARESEPRGERRKLQLAPRSKPVENGGASEKDQGGSAPSVFGSAKPVDTAAREREIEERLSKEQRSRLVPSRDSDSRDRDSGPSFASRDIRTNVERRVENHHSDGSSTAASSDDTRDPEEKRPVKKPSGVSAAAVFGSAKPVDTAAREREIEERLQKQRLSSTGDDAGEAEIPLSPDQDARGSASSTGRSAWSKGPPPSSSQRSGPPSGRGGAANSRPQHRKERKLPQSIDEMPVYEESRAKDFSDGNIYSGLLGSDVEDDRED